MKLPSPTVLKSPIPILVLRLLFFVVFRVFWVIERTDPETLNSLSDYVVSAETVNTFKNRLDRFWCNQDVLYDYRADLHGFRNRTIVM